MSVHCRHLDIMIIAAFSLLPVMFHLLFSVYIHNIWNIFVFILIKTACTHTQELSHVLGPNPAVFKMCWFVYELVADLLIMYTILGR